MLDLVLQLLDKVGPAALPVAIWFALLLLGPFYVLVWPQRGTQFFPFWTATLSFILSLIASVMYLFANFEAIAQGEAVIPRSKLAALVYYFCTSVLLIAGLLAWDSYGDYIDHFPEIRSGPTTGFFFGFLFSLAPVSFVLICAPPLLLWSVSLLRHKKNGNPKAD